MENEPILSHPFQKIDFSDFEGRAESLRRIERYSRYTPMYYRTNDLIHSERVCWLLEEIVPHIQEIIPDFDPEKARLLAHIHDDPEMITTDVPLVEKIKYTDQQKTGLQSREEEAIAQLVRQYPPTINGYSYEALLWHSQKKDCPEAIMMKLMDRLDGYGESWHEVTAGNTMFLGAEDQSPVKIYKNVLLQMTESFPLIREVLKLDHPLLQAIIPYDVEAFAERGKPHTAASLLNPVGIPQYDFWKKVTIKHLGQEGVALLSTQKEFAV